MAASVLAENRNASMNEIATASGVGRATLYRYFPTREHLLSALADSAVQMFAARIADAGLDRPSGPEALRRLSRASLAVADHYVTLVSAEYDLRRDTGEEAQRIVGSVRSVFERAIADGTLRDDLDVDLAVDLYAGIIVVGINAGIQRSLGLEDAAEFLTSIFLHGTSVPGGERR